MRSPGFSLLAIGCLTLAIGANAAVFSWIEGILLRPFPLVTDQDRLVAVAGTNARRYRPAGIGARTAARTEAFSPGTRAGKGVR